MAVSSTVVGGPFPAAGGGTSSSGSVYVASLSGVLVADAQSMPIGSFSGNTLKRLLVSFFIRNYQNAQGTVSFKWNGVAIPQGFRVTESNSAVTPATANAFAMNGGVDGRAMLIDCILDLRSGFPRLLDAYATQFAANGNVSSRVRMLCGKSDTDFTTDITAFSVESDTASTFGTGSSWKTWQITET